MPSQNLEYLTGLAATKHILVNIGVERGKKVGVESGRGKVMELQIALFSWS